MDLVRSLVGSLDARSPVPMSSFHTSIHEDASLASSQHRRWLVAGHRHVPQPPTSMHGSVQASSGRSGIKYVHLACNRLYSSLCCLSLIPVLLVAKNNVQYMYIF